MTPPTDTLLDLLVRAHALLPDSETRRDIAVYLVACDRRGPELDEIDVTAYASPPLLSVRTENRIARAGLTLAQPKAIAAFGKRRWARERGVGRWVIWEIENWLAHYGLEMHP